MQVSLDLEPSPLDSRTFCYYYVNAISEAIIVILLMVIGVAIFIKAVRQFLKTRKINTMTRIVQVIYIAIFLWNIFFLSKMIFAIALYWSSSPDKTKTSHYLFVVDIIGVFLIQAVLILVPYNWMQTIKMFQASSKKETNAYQQQNSITLQLVVVKILQFYLIFRFLFFGLIITFLVLQNENYYRYLLSCMLIVLLIEALFVGITLIIGLYAVTKQNTLSEIVAESQITSMKKRYKILIFCAFLRLIIDGIFSILTMMDRGKTKCNIHQNNIDDNGLQLFQKIVNILLQALLTHYFPIYLTLRIFKVEQKSIELSHSLLIASDNTQPVGSDISIPTQQKSSSNRLYFPSQDENLRLSSQSKS